MSTTRIDFSNGDAVRLRTQSRQRYVVFVLHGSWSGTMFDGEAGSPARPFQPTGTAHIAYRTSDLGRALARAKKEGARAVVVDQGSTTVTYAHRALNLQTPDPLAIDRQDT